MQQLLTLRRFACGWALLGLLASARLVSAQQAPPAAGQPASAPLIANTERELDALRKSAVEQVRYYLDGQPLPEAALRQLDPQQLDRIEVLKSHAAARYARDSTVTGVILMFSKPPAGRKPRAN